MKIVVLGTRGFPGVQGGIEKHCEQLYTRLADNGFDIVVFARRPYVDFDRTNYKGVSVIAVNCTRNKYLEAFTHTLKGMFKAYRLKPDIVHIHGIGPSLFAPLARLFGLKIVITSHGSDYQRLKWPYWAKICLRLGERLGARYADEIITITESISKDLARKYGRESTVIPNGVEKSSIVESEHMLKSLGLQKQKYILAVGRIVPEKGFDILINAYNRMQGQNGGLRGSMSHSPESVNAGRARRTLGNDLWKLVLVGSADHEDTYSRNLRKLAKKNSQIILTGSLTGRSLEELFSHAGLFVLPSYYEGLSIVLLEAMSYGLSCIVSDIPANTYVGLSDDRYFKVGRIDALEAKINEFLNKPLKEEEKRRQIDIVAEKHSWDNIASQTMEIYDAVPVTKVHMPEKSLNEYKQYNFLGTLIDCVTYDDLYEKVDTWIKNKKSRSHHIAVVNAYCATMAFKNHDLLKIYNSADLVGPDGMPFVYWMRVFLKQSCDQFDASSILIKLVERAESAHYSFYLYGGHPDVLEKMKRNLEAQYPYINIVGYKSPPFRELTDEEMREVCDEINRLQPDILCVGLGTPKQDFWINEHINKIRGSVIVPCGAIFDFFGGRIQRAPKFIRQLCAEWLYRLFSKDFKRLWFRYTVLNIIFLWNFFLQVIGHKFYPAQRQQRPEV